MTTIDQRQGRCYQLAAKAIRDNPAFKKGALVHGTVNGRVGRIGHAWVATPTGTIYEPVTDHEWPIEEFVAKFGPSDERRFTLMEAMQAMIRTGHWGPW